MTEKTMPMNDTSRSATPIEPIAAPQDATLQGFSGYLMKCAFNTILADLTEVLKPFGLRRMPFTALVLIADNPGITQTQLAQALAIERSNLVLVLDDLESRDLVLRNRLLGDRRASALTATIAGHRLRDKLVKAVTAHEQRLLAPLTQDERRTLNTLLLRVAGFSVRE